MTTEEELMQVPWPALGSVVIVNDHVGYVRRTRDIDGQRQALVRFAEWAEFWISVEMLRQHTVLCAGET